MKKDPPNNQFKETFIQAFLTGYDAASQGIPRTYAEKVFTYTYSQAQKYPNLSQDELTDLVQKKFNKEK